LQAHGLFVETSFTPGFVKFIAQSHTKKGAKNPPLYNKKVLIADTEKEVLRLSDSRSFPPWSSKDRAKA
jgi:hypothetical protein